MYLKSALFQNDRRLEACLSSDVAPILPDHQGDFVRKLHSALQNLDNARIGSFELANALYGPTTAQAVLAFKRRRGIVSASGRLRVTNIVCRLTLAAMDRELTAKEPSAITAA